MRTDTSKTIYRTDYQPYPFHLHAVDLSFDLSHDKTIALSNLSFEPKGQTPQDLVLDGQSLQTESISINGELLDKSEYKITATQLTIKIKINT